MTHLILDLLFWKENYFERRVKCLLSLHTLIHNFLRLPNLAPREISENEDTLKMRQKFYRPPTGIFIMLIVIPRKVHPEILESEIDDGRNNSTKSLPTWSAHSSQTSILNSSGHAFARNKPCENTRKYAACQKRWQISPA